MVIGLAFTAHQYYHDFGGQGWLKARTQHREGNSANIAQVYLPLRQIQRFKESSINERQVGKNVPYYTCGDQQNSCESFSQPDICCPVQMACFAASFTVSGIYCCNATDSEFKCQATKAHPPQCMASLVECSSETGGGCCPSALECSPNGCVHVNNASIISSPTTIWPPSSSDSSQSTQVPASVTSNSLGIPITVTSTIFQAPAATVTLAKEGEIAQAGVGAGSYSMIGNLWVPYSSVLFIVCIAIVMGRL
ncbi:hypothetical protein EG329_012965 [Mollisiaceae sp. DMI_Dod_QoI]|nr:hypothetical protein EG329_012965 [Helotiales sp. DMI_Dod_QoI]